jgi:hypothetical protein
MCTILKCDINSTTIGGSNSMTVFLRPPIQTAYTQLTKCHSQANDSDRPHPNKPSGHYTYIPARFFSTLPSSPPPILGLSYTTHSTSINSRHAGRILSPNNPWVPYCLPNNNSFNLNLLRVLFPFVQI